MRELFEVDQRPEPVPPGAGEADPAEAMRTLYQRINDLELTWGSERRQTKEAMRALLDTLLQVRDQLGETYQRYGVTTSAHEAAIARRTAESVQLIEEGLARLKVTPIETVGKPLDRDTSEISGYEHDRKARAGIVLRETLVGYRWPFGVIRFARVIVNDPQAAKRGQSEGDLDNAPSLKQS